MQKPKIKSFALEWKPFSKSKYIHLLIVLIGFYVLSPFLEGTKVEYFVISGIFLFAIILTLRALETSAKTFWLCSAPGILALLVEISMGLERHETYKQILTMISLFIYAVFLMIAISFMIHKMFSTVKVTGDTILGGISVYLLIGFLWAIFYFMMYFFNNQAFNIRSEGAKFHLLYFSFITLTTAGYGDIYPISRTAMVAASSEAVVGQLYLTIFVARIVGMYITQQLLGAKN